jgi:SAM-dependent MidA family methyltransferase
VEELIRAEIAQLGSIPFERFMDLALYHPQHGYYARRPVIGRRGDFYTSVSVGPLFGRLLAVQFREMWERLDKPSPFWIIEQGAHDGQLARDILAWCQSEAPEFAKVVRYAVAGSAAFEGVIAFLNPAELAAEKPVGVFFSNELVDAFPVHLIIRRDGEWRERHVVAIASALAFSEKEITSEALADAIKELNPPPIERYTTEINLRARAWMQDVARALRRGYVLTVDYGYMAGEYYAPHRTAGTLMAYSRHQRHDDVTTDPGERDLTAHVDFTALANAGAAHGLRPLALVDQQRFLTGIAHDEIAGASTLGAGVASHLRAFQTLTHPQHLGARFFALVQGKDAPAELSGLRFARSWEG